MVKDQQILSDVEDIKRKLISDAKQLRANNFIKSFWQLIISTSNATLEVSSLRVLFTYSLYLTLSLRMKPFGVFPDYFSFDHFLVTSYCFQEKRPNSLDSTLNFM